jgi:hypothetical protein
MHITRLLIVVSLLAMPLGIGCGGTNTGPASVELSGRVTLDGDPLKEGDIFFRAQDGGNSYAAKIKDGTYQQNVTPGNKRVEITSYRDVPGQFREDNPGEKVPVREMYIPSQFNKETTLELDVPGDKKKHVHDFELVSGG